MNKPQIYVDLDGVLSDIEGHYESCFKERMNQDTYEPIDMWDKIREHGNFYRDQPLKLDALELWRGVKIHHPSPIILSGIPRSIPNVAAQKRIWVDRHLGRHVELICCFSRDKIKYAHPGDILIDDRTKYMKYWIQGGGIFVFHTSAKNTLARLANLYAGNPI